MVRLARCKNFASLTTIAAVLGVAAWGCDDGKPPVSSSMTEAKVKGTVTVKGKRLTKGQVTFNPSNYLRKTEPPRSAPISQDGAYEITTLVGENMVTLEKTGQEKALGYQLMTCDVKEGENVFDIELPKHGP